jgi:hypothetical protein
MQWKKKNKREDLFSFYSFPGWDSCKVTTPACITEMRCGNTCPLKKPKELIKFYNIFYIRLYVWTWCETDGSRIWPHNKWKNPVMLSYKELRERAWNLHGLWLFSSTRNLIGSLLLRRMCPAVLSIDKMGWNQRWTGEAPQSVRRLMDVDAKINFQKEENYKCQTTYTVTQNDWSYVTYVKIPAAAPAI